MTNGLLCALMVETQIGWGPGGGAYLIDVVAAYDAAAADGVDVINYSYGATASTPNMFFNPVSLAQRGAAAMGVSVCASAGNEGPEAETVNNPGTLLCKQVRVVEPMPCWY